MRRAFFTLLLLAGVAFAHSELEAASPARNAVVTALPEAVTLGFSEALELPFSTFKVYLLEADPNEGNPQKLDGLAGALVDEVLSAQGDEAARADTGVTTGERRAADVTLALKDGLEPGHYVVMWRALSVDSHTLTGFYRFTYAPET